MTEDSFEQVKKLMKIIGGKALIVEDGKPSFVVINVDEYTDFEDIVNSAGSETELIEKINKDITIWKNKQKEREIKQLEKDFEKKESREIEII
jgi:PHD/YefM family antitoxin component YafN of YafNO toxin-antitoxin module